MKMNVGQPDVIGGGVQGLACSLSVGLLLLLNEFLKARQQIDAQQKQIEMLAAGPQKISAQLELSRAAPQTVCLPATCCECLRSSFTRRRERSVEVSTRHTRIGRCD